MEEGVVGKRDSENVSGMRSDEEMLQWGLLDW